ncbi:MAG: aquaporin [Oscillatoria sp. SIO1A7]|nr:aquaporin [Oscillatoria sp. SIO1A7]
MSVRSIKLISKLPLGDALSQCWREAIAEFLGTFILIFTGTGAVMVNSITDGAVSHLGICFVFGATVSAVIYSIGHLSGAHINPAVTLAFWVGGFFPKQRVLPYILAQSLGAIAASATLRLTLGPIGNLGATVPLGGNWLQSFVVEIIITFILMFVILGAAVDSRAHKSFAGLTIGLTVTFLAIFMGPVSGASMNPARSLGPALISGVWQHHWIYWLAPIIGAGLAVLVYRPLFLER